METWLLLILLVSFLASKKEGPRYARPAPSSCAAAGHAHRPRQRTALYNGIRYAWRSAALVISQRWWIFTRTRATT